jgi:hypothetical protein
MMSSEFFFNGPKKVSQQINRNGGARGGAVVEALR